MVSGCSDGMPKDNTDSVAVSDDVVSDLMMVESESDAGLETVNDAVETSDTSVGTEQTETSETEEQSGDSSNVEVSITEELTANDTSREAESELSATEAPSEPEIVATQPTTDDRGNPADGSPVFEITFNIPEEEYVGYDADRVARLAVEKCKAAGMITLPENLDRLLAEGKITQEEYNEYYPYDGMENSYYSVFVETNLLEASTTSGRKLGSEDAIATHIADMLALENGSYVYVEYSGIYNLNGTDFYEFRCYR